MLAKYVKAIEYITFNELRKSKYRKVKQSNKR